MIRISMAIFPESGLTEEWGLRSEGKVRKERE